MSSKSGMIGKSSKGRKGTRVSKAGPCLAALFFFAWMVNDFMMPAGGCAAGAGCLTVFAGEAAEHGTATAGEQVSEAAEHGTAAAGEPVSEAETAETEDHTGHADEDADSGSGTADGDHAACRTDTVAMAHAGGASAAPENTLAAFRAAREAGADAVETDVRMTKDHELVLWHDDKIDALTDGEGMIHELTLEELKALDVGAWFGEAHAGEKILTLEEGLAAMKEMGYELVNVELKPVMGPENRTRLVHLTADLIRQADMADRVMISSFDHTLLKEMKEYAPEIPAAMLTIPDLRAVLLFNLSQYFPEEKALQDYTAEDVSTVPAPVAMLVRNFGERKRNTTDEEFVLEVIRGIAAVVPEDSSWKDVETLLREEADLTRFVDSLDFPVDYLNCHHSSLHEGLVDDMHERGIRVFVWTPNSRQDLEKTLSFGPDGIITDEPALLKQIISGPEGEPESVTESVKESVKESVAESMTESVADRQNRPLM